MSMREFGFVLLGAVCLLFVPGAGSGHANSTEKLITYRCPAGPIDLQVQVKRQLADGVELPTGWEPRWSKLKSKAHPATFDRMRLFDHRRTNRPHWWIECHYAVWVLPSEDEYIKAALLKGEDGGGYLLDAYLERKVYTPYSCGKRGPDKVDCQTRPSIPKGPPKRGIPRPRP